MSKKLYVANLSYNIDKDRLEQTFAAHGSVTSAQLITDQKSGQSKGFGFVEMGSEAEALSAIAALDGKNIEGRNLKVSAARTQEPRSAAAQK